MNIEAIQIRRGGGENDDGYVLLSVCVNGIWVEVAQEPIDSSFSHIVEEAFIEKRLGCSEIDKARDWLDRTYNDDDLPINMPEAMARYVAAVSKPTRT